MYEQCLCIVEKETGWDIIDTCLEIQRSKILSKFVNSVVLCHFNLKSFKFADV